MSRSLRRGAIAALVLAAIVPLSACAAGNTSATLEVKPDNAATSIGTDLQLNNIVVVTPAGAHEYSGPATLTVNISNTGTKPEALKSATIGDAAVTFTDAQGVALPEIVIPAGGAVLLGGAGQPVAKTSSAKVTVGGTAPTAFTFGTAGKVSSLAYVQPAVGYYASFGPKAEAVPSAKPSASVSPAASASATASATAGASATAPVSPAATAGASAPAAPSGSASPSTH